MRLTTIMALGLAFVAVGALVFRVARLETRPMHADEAVQATRFQQLWHGSGYRYDPDEFHGPTLTYLTWPSIWVTRPKTFGDTTSTTYRIVPAIFGTALILLLAWLVDGLGRIATVAAALLTAISPAMVFYSRDYIHEMLLVFFSLAALATAWRYARTGKLIWCLAAGTSIGLTQATKETAVLSYAAAGLGLLVVRFVFGRGSPSTAVGCERSEPPAIDRTSDAPSHHHPTIHTGGIRATHLAAATALGVLTTVLFLSSFGDNPRGPWDGVLTYLPWLSRAGGASPHVQPWYFYLHRLAAWQTADGPIWSEGLILALGGFALLVVLLRPKWLPDDANIGFLRWLSAYTLALTVLYSCIPYKTPWCALQFLIGWILLAGVGTGILWSRTKPAWWRPAVGISLLTLTIHLAWQAYRASYVLPADPSNPYVYAQTLDDIRRLANDVHELAQAVEPDRSLQIAIVWDGPYYWPLPWYLREHQDVGYWSSIPDNAVDASVVIAAPQFDASLTQALEETHLMIGYYGIRPGTLAEMWVHLHVWTAHLRRLGRLPTEESPAGQSSGFKP